MWLIVCSCFAQASPALMQSRHMANVSGAVVELSNYLEQRISQKSEEFAKVLTCNKFECVVIVLYFI